MCCEGGKRVIKENKVMGATLEMPVKRHVWGRFVECPVRTCFRLRLIILFIIVKKFTGWYIVLYKIVHKTEPRMMKIKVKTTENKDNFADRCSDIMSGTISVFLLLLVTVFPLILHNSYTDILKTKYQCYYVIAIGMLAVVLVLAIIMLIVDQMRYHGKYRGYFFFKITSRTLEKHMLYGRFCSDRVLGDIAGFYVTVRVFV